MLAGGIPALALLCAAAPRAQGADPFVVLSIASGSPQTICDTGCTTCTVASGECISTSQTDLIMCKPTSSGIPITACKWSVLLQGASMDLNLNNQIRAAGIAPNGNITFVMLNDTSVPGIGTLTSNDIAVFNPSDVLQPFVGGGPYTEGTFKLYLDGAQTQGMTAKPWDAFDLLADGTCEKGISASNGAKGTCDLIGSLTSGSGSQGLGGVHFQNQDLLRCRPNGFAMNGTIESCDYAMFLDASNINGRGNGINSDIEAIDFLSYNPSTLSGQMVFKMAGGNPPGFPPHDDSHDLLLYNGTFGAGNCTAHPAQPCANNDDCPMLDTCNTGTCNIGATACASDSDCTGSGNFCNSTRFPVATVTEWFDGATVGLSGSGQKIEALAILHDTDGDGIPDGIDNCPAVANPPSVCSGGVATCPSHLSTECPMGETCVQADSDHDGVGDACDQCNGRPDPGTCSSCPGTSCPAACTGGTTPECTCGDGILDLPSEQCDLGNQNGASGSPCSASCKISGKCTTSMTSCTTAADCPMGEGCCGNDIVESPETCDDGNNIDNDVCHNNCTINPAGTAIVGCDDLTGPNIIQASIKVTKFKDTKPLGEFDRWKTTGSFIYAQGLTISPSTQPVTITYNNTATGTLFQSTIHPPDCPTTPCFVQNGTKLQWKFLDKLANLMNAPSWHKGKLKIKNNQAKFGLDGRNVDLFTSMQAGTSMRQTIRIGDVCVTGVVSCTPNGKGTSLKCALAP